MLGIHSLLLPLFIFESSKLLMRNLRIIYMGTPDFAVPSLEILLQNNFNVIAVITAPDKPAGRGRKVQQSAVKQCALKHDIPVLQPTNLKDPTFVNELQALQADLQIVVAFRMLPKIIWDMPELGTFNLHASLLPQYRGAAPINWAIINGEKETGLTTFFLKHEIDTGEIILQEKEPIHPEDSVGTLYARLMSKGAHLVLKSCLKIQEGDCQTYPQEIMACALQKKAPKIFRETCQINFHQSAQDVHNFVRGLSPHPVAWTVLEDKICRIYRVKAIQQKHTNLAGTWCTDHKTYLRFFTKDGYVNILELQLRGRKRMGIQDFLRGIKLIQPSK